MKRPGRISYHPVREVKPFENARRDTRFYNSAVWRNCRNAYFAAHPVCVMCHRAGQVVDHIRPVNPVDAYDTQGGAFGEPLHYTNLQTLCHKCHNSKSGRSK
jgi:5-methylcytosine-specific restriction enzyme A